MPQIDFWGFLLCIAAYPLSIVARHSYTRLEDKQKRPPTNREGATCWRYGRTVPGASLLLAGYLLDVPVPTCLGKRQSQPFTPHDIFALVRMVPAAAKVGG